MTAKYNFDKYGIHHIYQKQFLDCSKARLNLGRTLEEFLEKS